jgi:hypothetical protein
MVLQFKECGSLDPISELWVIQRPLYMYIERRGVVIW